MQHIGQIHSLEELHLIDTSVTNGGLESISNLTNLKVLAVESQWITDDSIEHLKKLPSLRVVFSDDSGISRKGRAELYRAIRERSAK